MRQAPTDVVMPRQVQWLPRDQAGRPIPWWVQTVDGVPDYRTVSRSQVLAALRIPACWICGWTFGPRVALTFAGGTLLSWQSTEPPAHEACAVYATRVCPFLASPEHAGDGVVAVWTTRDVEVFPADTDPVIRAGAPVRVSWWREGRPATRGEAAAALDVALETLGALTESPGTLAHLKARHAAAAAWLPPEEP